MGIHACTGPACSTTAPPLPSDYMALARYLAALPLDGESVPRFYVVADSEQLESQLLQEIWAMNLTGARGTGVAQSKRHRAAPSSLAALQEEVADLHLLSQTTLVIGTPGSAGTQAAAAWGGCYLMLAGEGSSAALAGMGVKAGAAPGGLGRRVAG